MKACLIGVALGSVFLGPIAPPATGAQPPEAFPMKGEAFFLSVKIHTPFEGYAREALEPCEEPFLTKKIKDRINRIVARTALNVEIVFRGNWTSRIHRTSAKCRDYLSEHGPAFSRMDKKGEFHMVL
ncbi:MAG: hypothetical protein V3U86_00355 [Acidobacteriota bacterium]